MYAFRVAAVNKAGCGPPSEESDLASAKDPVFAPSRPGAPEVTDMTATTVFLLWTPPRYNGGTEILGYIIESRDEVK